MIAETRLVRRSETKTKFPGVLARYLDATPPGYLFLTIWYPVSGTVAT